MPNVLADLALESERLHREAPLYSIWEGSGNVAALDVVRALRREESSRPC
jgi:alkylation response protein AidB-like acyl-CoA dehydrogenase